MSMRKSVYALIASVFLLMSMSGAFALNVSAVALDADLLELTLVPVDLSDDVTVEAADSMDTIITLKTIAIERTHVGFVHVTVDSADSGSSWQMPLPFNDRYQLE